jgi:hypothetical protein
MYIGRPFVPTGLLACTEDSCPAWLASACIEVSSTFTFLAPASICNDASNSFGGYDTIRDTLLAGNLRGNFIASFAVGWMCTTVSRQAYGYDELEHKSPGSGIGCIST